LSNLSAIARIAKEGKVSNQESRNPQHSDPQKPGNQPNIPVTPKQEIPAGQPKTPQPVQEKHDEEKKKPA
jgi:hypothetical protein